MDMKFLVINLEDVHKYCSPIKQADLAKLVDYINYCRHEDGKKDNEYLVVNKDEPYAEAVEYLIKFFDK